MRILVVEDYEPIRKAVSQGLEEVGFAVDQAIDGLEAVALCETSDYDVIVLDLMLPKIDGQKVLETVRERGHGSKVLVLSAKSDARDRISCLNQGADDYMVKPFHFEELVARVRALSRRKYDRTSPVIEVEDMTINTASKSVIRKGQQIDLTRREFALLEYLAVRAGEVVSRNDIWDHVYDRHDGESTSNLVEVYVGYLRKKLERTDWPRILHTRRGQGYVLGATE